MKLSSSIRPGYTAFLSHSHKDREQVKWLAGVLEGYWVPGNSRRRIFLDRKSLIAGSLDVGIKRALDASEYLVICVSGSVPGSRWVTDEIEHFLGKENRPPERVLICRVGGRADKDPEGDERASGWIAALEKRLDRKPLEHLTPDLREESVEDATASALSLLAPMVGMADKDALLDRRARFLARSWRIASWLVVVLFASGAGVWWWLRTPDGAMWRHQRALITKAPGLKFDHTEWVGPAVLALARADEPKSARGLAAMVKGRFFYATMMLAIEAGVSVPDQEKVRMLVKEAGSDLGAGFPRAGLLGARVAGGEEERQQAWSAMQGKIGEEAWMRALAASGWWSEAMEAWERWRRSHPQDASEHFPLWLELHLLAEKPLDASVERGLRQEWLQRLEEDRSLYHIQIVLVDAALRRRVREPVWRELLAAVAAHAERKLSAGIDPGTAAQPLAAIVALAGLHDKASNLLRRTAYLEEAPLDNSHAEPLAFRALAEFAIGNESTAEPLFVSALAAANAPIESSRTWHEHFAVAQALVLAGQWRRATELPDMIGNEMTRRTLELELIVWWHLQKSSALR
ncbi:TIR domain-containing protein [Phragmitibacter flavus]|uniref:TIR domain-containing protein n=1 Tax=Phragmitibacter flavus TaxID=2576071 RepID=A0A5R8KHB7_9BACT|nr:toll/interleukin-1 receptor domain-containing protein [Phragmitibacter flavus]TLD71704.1 TIR domain-containing protein [Phragmitibacter flavus]